MTAFEWPEGIYPVLQSYYIRPITIQSVSDLTGLTESKERDGTRWIATLDFRLAGSKAAVMDALIARLNGSTGNIVVPDFRRTKSRTVTGGMDDYADRAGLSFFDDEHDFNDMTQDGGFLTFEESVPLALEENILFCAGFDAFLFGPDDVFLLTEAGEEIWGENVDIPILSEKGIKLTLEEGPPMEVGMEEGFGMETETGDDIVYQVGGRFFEGSGTPRLVGGGWNKLAIDGLAPWAQSVLLAGESIQGSHGRAYLILADVTTDINGYSAVLIAPRVREAIEQDDLMTGSVGVLMRLLDNETGRNDTRAPVISAYQLRFEEVL